MKRREFITLLGGAAAAWPLMARAQQPEGKIATIGILAIEPWPPIDTFRRALNDLGHIEGKNLRFVHRYAKGRNERLSELANELVGLNADVILTWGPTLCSPQSKPPQRYPSSWEPSAILSAAGSLRIWHIRTRTSQDCPPALPSLRRSGCNF
jgi:hypothetical protein